MERRLAAILAADVVGYSRLVGADEEGTLRTLRAYREVIDGLVAAHGGRVFGSAGDSVVAEFASPVEAVRCASKMQRELTNRNSGLPDNRRMVFRVGVNLGDVVVESGNLLGDGVNVAARLQEIADPGGICVSDDIRRYAEGKGDLTFIDLGERHLKNIAEPVRAYRVAIDAAEAMTETTTPPLPDKPSIAVLPFTNMSGDPEQEYFADGITEDIITELSRFRSLMVIARNSSFHYKGASPKVQDIGRELGVHYVVEGSVRKAGNRVRVTAQLVEAATGSHVWAERYDRDLEDIFAVQDELTAAIASAIPGRLDAVATEHANRKPVESLTAYDYLLRATSIRNRDPTDPRCLELCEKAIEADPRCARAYTLAAAYHSYSVWAHAVPKEIAHAEARRMIEQALTLDDGDPRVHETAAGSYIEMGDHDLARHHIERAIALNPNDAQVMMMAGLVYTYLGNLDKSAMWHDKLLRLDPHVADAWRENIFDARYMRRQYDQAIALMQGWRNPPFHMYLELAAAYAQSGRMDEALNAFEQYNRLVPEGYDRAGALRIQLEMCAREEDREHWRQGYRILGLSI